MKAKKFIVYRIWYGQNIVYVGRTKQPLQSRIRGHLFSKPMHRTICMEQVTKIDFAELKSEADMNLYEIYYILKYKPTLNVDDKTPDQLSVFLPELDWTVFSTPLWDKWKAELQQKIDDCVNKNERIRQLTEQVRILRSQRRMHQISEERFFEEFDRLSKEVDELEKERHFW